MVGRRRDVVVHYKDGRPSIKGLLSHRGRRYYLLRNAGIIVGVDATEPLGGEVEVQREDVYCLQRV